MEDLLTKFSELGIEINQHHLKRYFKFITSLMECNANAESHHILPKSIFPLFKNKRDSPWNQKRISTRAHYICHWMLWKSLPGCIPMVNAFWAMNVTREGLKRKCNSRTYEALKMDKSKSQSKFMMGKTYAKGQIWDEERREAMSNRVKGEGNPFYGIGLPDKALEAAREFHKNVSKETRKSWMTEETKLKISTANKGRKMTTEQLEANSNRFLALPYLDCPHCGLNGRGPNMKRYHFNNCKKLSSDTNLISDFLS